MLSGSREILFTLQGMWHSNHHGDGNADGYHDGNGTRHNSSLCFFGGPCNYSVGILYGGRTSWCALTTSSSPGAASCTSRFACRGISYAVRCLKGSIPSSGAVLLRLFC